MKKKTETKGNPELIKQVKAERAKIKRRVRRLEKRGYSLPKNIVPEIPQSVRDETLYRFQKYNMEFLYRKAVYVSPEGTKVKGYERLKQERSERSKKAAETRRAKFYERKQIEDRQIKAVTPTPSNESIDDNLIILETLYDTFQNWTPLSYWSTDLANLKQRDRDIGWATINGAIDKLGKEQVAKNVASRAIEVWQLADKILYESGNDYRLDSRDGNINLSLTELSAILFGRALTIEESIRFTAMGEYNQNHDWEI